MARVLATPHCPVDFSDLRHDRVPVPGWDVSIDVCPKCQGVYLDHGEIKKLTGHDKLNELLTKHVALDSDSAHVCPGCGMVMDMEEADGVKVDVCLSCFGVWLDHGELDQLKAATDDSKFLEFSPAKVAELERAKKVKAADRRRWWNQFMRRLAGLDLAEAAMRRRPK